jgi:putative component of membrane protein insertase Oxa1/YidC/SpoIIIJ protein YidD
LTKSASPTFARSQPAERFEKFGAVEHVRTVQEHAFAAAEWQVSKRILECHALGQTQRIVECLVL